MKMTEFENINVSVWEKINRLEGFNVIATEIIEEYQLKAEKKNLKAIGIIGDFLPKPKSELVSILNLCLRIGILEEKNGKVCFKAKAVDFVKSRLKAIYDYEKNRGDNK